MRATASEAEIARFALSVDDVVVTKDSESWNDIGVPALVVETSGDLVCGYHLALLRPRKDVIDGAFLFRCLQAKPIQMQLALSANGVTRFGLTKSEIASTVVPVPPMPKQRAIVKLLNSETGQLDALVAETEGLLRLLEEKRQTLVTRAVTRGLNSDIPFRDSGIAWLGEIPEHWDTERARWLFCERNQRSTTGCEELLTVSHLTGVTPRSEKEVNMFEAQTTEGYKICLRGDLVVNTLWAWMGAMGVASTDGIVSPAYNVYSPETALDPEYVDVLVRLRVFAQEVTRHSMGVWSSRLRLYPDGFFAVHLPVPPLVEQQEIVRYLRRSEDRIHNLKETVTHTRALAGERRAALIAGAVTAQIDVEDGA